MKIFKSVISFICNMLHYMFHYCAVCCDFMADQLHRLSDYCKPSEDAPQA